MCFGSNNRVRINGNAGQNYWRLATLHWRSASLKPSQRDKSDWFCAHSRNCLISHEQAPPAGAELGTASAAAGAAGATASLEPPLNIPVMACPRVCPTADPMATPPAVAAIWPMRDGCCGWAIIGVDAGAWAGTEDGGGAALAGAGAGLTLKAYFKYPIIQYATVQDNPIATVVDIARGRQNTKTAFWRTSDVEPRDHDVTHENDANNERRFTRELSKSHCSDLRPRGRRSGTSTSWHFSARSFWLGSQSIRLQWRCSGSSQREVHPDHVRPRLTKYFRCPSVSWIALRNYAQSRDEKRQ